MPPERNPLRGHCLMDIMVYKWLHIVGAFAVIMAFGALIFRSSVHSESSTTAIPKKTLSIVHGLGLVILLVSGFGMLARLGIHGDLPAWVILKGVIWLALGGLIAAVNRAPSKNKLWWWLVLALAAAAAWIGLFKV